MRRSGPLASLALYLLCASICVIPLHAQLKDMPSQAEFDPILENADKKLKDFAATLIEYRTEANELDQERLTDDLDSIKQIQQIIQTAHGGSNGEGNGVNIQRTFAIVSGLDDMAMDAGTWKELAELQMCKQAMQKEDPSRQSQFGIRVGMNREMLREVSNQLFHPTLRLGGAADEIILKLSEPTSKRKTK